MFSGQWRSFCLALNVLISTMSFEYSVIHEIKYYCISPTYHYQVHMPHSIRRFIFLSRPEGKRHYSSFPAIGLPCDHDPPTDSNAVDNINKSVFGQITIGYGFTFIKVKSPTNNGDWLKLTGMPKRLLRTVPWYLVQQGINRPVIYCRLVLVAIIWSHVNLLMN